MNIKMIPQVHQSTESSKVLSLSVKYKCKLMLSVFEDTIGAFRFMSTRLFLSFLDFKNTTYLSLWRELEGGFYKILCEVKKGQT